jgi:hypothetical protein
MRIVEFETKDGTRYAIKRGFWKFSKYLDIVSFCSNNPPKVRFWGKSVMFFSSCLTSDLKLIVKILNTGCRIKPEYVEKKLNLTKLDKILKGVE